MRVKLFSLFTLVSLSFSAFAQDEAALLKYGSDKDACEQNLSIYTEFYKQKNYVDAYKSWVYLFDNAPKRTKNIYIHGPKIIKGLIKSVTEESRNTVLLDSLMMVYDQRNKYYPGSEARVLGYKGADMYRLRDYYRPRITQSVQLDFYRSNSGVFEIPCKVYGLDMTFIFDTGSSNVSISLTEASFLFRHGHINQSNFLGIANTQIANGEVLENMVIKLGKLTIAGIPLYDVEAIVVESLNAPLLLGMNAIEQLGTVLIEGDKLVLKVEDHEKHEVTKVTSTDGLQAAYVVLKEAFTMAGNSSTASVLNYYFFATTKLVQAKVLKVSDLIALFSDLSGVISYKEAKLMQDIYTAEQAESLSSKEAKILKKDRKELSTLSDVKENLEKTLEPHATCEKLVELYTANFDSKKEDISWLKRAAKLLNKKDCTNTDIFFTISEALYNIDPSPSAAANMGIRSLKRKDYDKALEFYSYALDNEEDNLNKAQYAYRLAQTYGAMNKNVSAKSYALKAASFRYGWGEPYILIGDLYAKTSRKCGELQTEFLKRVGYWAAIDKYEYAVSIDSSVKAKVADRVGKYTEQMPSKTDIFTEGLIDVPTYKIECWYTETVNVKVPE